MRSWFSLGNAKKAADELGWQAKTDLESLVKEMIAEDISIAKKEVLISKKGFNVSSPQENPPWNNIH